LIIYLTSLHTIFTENILVCFPYWLHTVVAVEEPVDALYFPGKDVGWDELEANETEEAGGDRETVITLGVDPADYRQEHVELLSTQLRTPQD